MIHSKRLNIVIVNYCLCENKWFNIPVYVESIPSIGKLDIRVCLERFLEQYALYGDAEMQQAESLGYHRWCQLKLDGWFISYWSWRVIHQMEACTRNGQGFLNDLRLSQDGRLVRTTFWNIWNIYWPHWNIVQLQYKKLYTQLNTHL